MKAMAVPVGAVQAWRPSYGVLFMPRVGKHSWNLPPTWKQLRVLERFGLDASCRLDASRLISQLASNSWRKIETPSDTKTGKRPYERRKTGTSTWEQIGNTRLQQAALWADYWAKHEDDT
jgi:hypothetical protein